MFSGFENSHHESTEAIAVIFMYVFFSLCYHCLFDFFMN